MEASNSLPKRILCIDGGGLKGILPASILANLEDSFGVKVVDQFDLIVGTSTGGIIALGLGLGLSPKEIVNFYEEKGPLIFDQQTNGVPQLLDLITNSFSKILSSSRRLVQSKYDGSALSRELNAVFGEKRIGDCATRIVVPAYDSETNKPYIFKTAHHVRLRTDYQKLASHAALATSAAPTYFPAYSFDGGVSIIDGGVWANNPMGIAAVEAVSMLGWSAGNTRMLSLGCGERLLSSKPNAGLVSALRGAWIVETLMQAQSHHSEATAKLILGHTPQTPCLIRVNPHLGEKYRKLDNAAVMGEMKAIGATLARSEGDAISQMFFMGRREDFVPFHR